MAYFETLILLAFADVSWVLRLKKLEYSLKLKIKRNDWLLFIISVEIYNSESTGSDETGDKKTDKPFNSVMQVLNPYKPNEISF